MMNIPFPDRWERPERILLAPAEPGDFTPLGEELTRRGAEAVTAASIAAAGEAARAGAFDAVFVRARSSAEATLLLLRLMTAEAPKARLLLVLDPTEAENLGPALMEAEEAMSIALSPRRMADAAGVGFHRSAAFA
jgi:DNA-binding NtrC family response regulator